VIVLIDTDVILDIALKRDPFYKDSVKLINLVENNKILGFVAWHTLSNFYYMTAIGSGNEKAKQFINDLLEFVNVAETNTENAKRAIQLKVPDFEDALQITAALACDAHFIISRNVKHYKNSPITALTPESFLKKHLVVD